MRPSPSEQSPSSREDQDSSTAVPEPEQQKTAITCDGICKAYVQDRRAAPPLVVLIDVTLTIRQGEFVTIVGPSGCGKTTLLNIMAGIDRPTRGSVSVSAQADRRAYLFQRDTLLPWRSALRNVELGLISRGLPKAERIARARQWLRVVGLQGFEDAYPAHLSGGMRRRVALATAFAHDPQVLFMDEPFGAVDAQTRLQLQGELLELWERDRKTVVFVTHDIEEALLLSDRVVVMSGRPGQIIDDASVPLARPRTVEGIRFEPTVADMARRIWQELRSELPDAPE